MLLKGLVVIMDNEPPAHIIIENFSDLKHKINNNFVQKIPIVSNLQKSINFVL